MLRIVKEGKNKRGDRIAIAQSTSVWGDKKLGVWALCQNYQAGRIVGTWRYIVNGVTEAEAETVFKRRTR